jgi:hypothetical protein
MVKKILQADLDQKWDFKKRGNTEAFKEGYWGG